MGFGLSTGVLHKRRPKNFAVHDRTGANGRLYPMLGELWLGKFHSSCDGMKKSVALLQNCATPDAGSVNYVVDTFSEWPADA